MDARISNLISNLQNETLGVSSQINNEDESNSLLKLIINNGLEYDADTIHKLILSNSANLRNTDILKQDLYQVSNTIADNQFQASLSLKRIQKKIEDEEQKQFEETRQNNEDDYQPAIETESESLNTVPTVTSGTSSNDELNELRKRLLSRKSTSLSSTNTSIEQQNEMHEKNQENLLGDMIGLVSQLRENMAKFNEDLENDSEIVKKTNKSLEKVGNAASEIGKRMKKFSEQNKMGFWFYIYTVAALIVVPLVMMAIIRLVPRF